MLGDMLNWMVNCVLCLLEQLGLAFLVPQWMDSWGLGHQYQGPSRKRCVRLVVVTGADSGFGLATTLELAARRGVEYHVLCTCMTDTGLARWDDMANVTAVRCDVTDAKAVQAVYDKAVALVATSRKGNTDAGTGKDQQGGGGPLVPWALVNNAGVADMGFTDWMAVETFRFTMEVNLLGMVSMTKAMLPLLKQTASARVVNVGSMAGLMAGPGFGAYSASKHAVEGFSKALRQELRPWGLHVSVVNPGFMKTPLIEASIAKAQKVFEASAVAEQYPADILSGDATQVRGMQEDPARVVSCVTGLVRRRSRPALNNYPGWQAQIGQVAACMPQFVNEEFMHVFRPTPGPHKHVLRAIRSEGDQ